MEKVQDNAITEEIREKPFLCGDVREDLDGWSRKLGALGNLISALAWHEKKGGSESLCSEGEILGSIIHDYAHAIELTIDQESGVLSNIDEGIAFPLARHQSVYDMMALTKDLNGTDLPAIQTQLKKLQTFTEETLIPVLRMTNGLEDMRKGIIENSTKQKETSTTETTAVEA